jgi:hypothetical protein
MASPAGKSLSLIQAVLEIDGERRTGVLDLTAEGVRTRIYFEDGKPVFAEDGAPGETFGRLLVRQGSIGDGELARVGDEVKRAAAGDDPLRFADAAVALGVLTREQLERPFVEHVCGIIIRALEREGSQWVFQPAPEAAKPPRSLALQINPAILAAEQAFQKGVALLRASETAAAAIELRRASELRPQSLQYLLYATWAEARNGSEVPSEADQKALLEIAQKAKKRDPAFAFGSYVIGQLSMWAGDDATAKKWFYEALRLDPTTSEAATQVRILARRSGVPSGLSGVWKLPEAPGPAEPAYASASEPPAAPAPAPAAPAAKEVQPPGAPPPPRRPVSSAPSKRRAERLVTVAVVVATAGFVVMLAATKAGPRAGMAPSALPQPAPSAGAAAPVALEPPAPSPPSAGPTTAAAVEGDPELERKSPRSMPEKAVDDGDSEKGIVRLPARASGHRIFVDGHRAEADGTAPLRLLCGPHVIQIGGHGTPEHIDLPCRGEIQLE